MAKFSATAQLSLIERKVASLSETCVEDMMWVEVDGVVRVGVDLLGTTC